MKILIVDDHALFREGLCYVLESLADEISLFEVSNCEHAIEFASKNPDLDMVLLDLNMPDRDGFSALDTFTEHYPATLVVVISASKQRSDMQRALDAGAVGYIPKDTTSEVMIGALRLVLSGGVYMPAGMLDEQKTNEVNSINLLTPRQVEVLQLLIHGESNKKIAQQLELAEATVKMHVTSILKGLGVNNRTQAVIAAKNLGLSAAQ